MGTVTATCHTFAVSPPELGAVRPEFAALPDQVTLAAGYTMYAGRRCGRVDPAGDAAGRHRVPPRSSRPGPQVYRLTGGEATV